MDRTIHFGDDAADARYRIQDTSSTGGDFVLAEDLDGGTVLLEYDYSASEWVSRSPVNLDGNDITNAGAISADTLEADDATVTNSPTNDNDVFRLVDYTPEADTHDQTVSSDIVITDAQVGTLADGDFLRNDGGSLTGAVVDAFGATGTVTIYEGDTQTPFNIFSGAGGVEVIFGYIKPNQYPTDTSLQITYTDSSTETIPITSNSINTVQGADDSTETLICPSLADVDALDVQNTNNINCEYQFITT